MHFYTSARAGAFPHSMQSWSATAQRQASQWPGFAGCHGVDDALLVSLQDDMLAGRRAGCVTVLLDGAHHYSSPEDVEEEMRPDFVIRSLSELCKVLSVSYDLPGKNIPTS